jgi:hypothetical protein
MTIDTHLSDRKELDDWITQRVSRGINRNDIIPEICMRTGLDWRDAEDYLVKVTQNRGHDIARQRLPLMLGLSLVFIVGGIVAIITSVSTFSNYYQSLPQPLDDSSLSYLALFAGTHYTSIIKLVVGIAMIAGGAIGLGRALVDRGETAGQ